MCRMANRVAGFGSHECMWIQGKTLEPVFHRVFICYLTGGRPFLSKHVPDESTEETLMNTGLDLCEGRTLFTRILLTYVT